MRYYCGFIKVKKNMCRFILATNKRESAIWTRANIDIMYGTMKCMPRNLVIVLEPRMNPPHSHRASELPMFDGITVNRLVMTVAPQKLI